MSAAILKLLELAAEFVIYVAGSASAQPPKAPAPAHNTGQDRDVLLDAVLAFREAPAAQVSEAWRIECGGAS